MSGKGLASCDAGPLDGYMSVMKIGLFVFQRPRVKSGKSTERLLFATDSSLTAATALHVAAS